MSIKLSSQISTSKRHTSLNSTARGRRFDVIGKALLKWYGNIQSPHKLTRANLTSKAKQIAKDLSIHEFKASSPWIIKWEKEHGIKITNFQNCYQRNKLTIRDKINIVNQIKSGVSQMQVSKAFKVSTVTIHHIWRKRALVKSLTNVDVNGFRLPREKTHKIDMALMEWCKNNDITTVSKSAMIKKAKQIAKELKVSTFKGSDTWLKGWTKVYGAGIGVTSLKTPLQKGNNGLECGSLHEPKIISVERRNSSSIALSKSPRESSSEVEVDDFIPKQLKFPSNHCGFYKGLEIDRIMGATLFQDQLCFVVKFKNCKEMEVIAAKIVNHEYPQNVITFYESKMMFGKDNSA